MQLTFLDRQTKNNEKTSSATESHPGWLEEHPQLHLVTSGWAVQLAGLGRAVLWGGDKPCPSATWWLSFGVEKRPLVTKHRGFFGEPSPSSLAFTLWGKNIECWKVCKVHLPLCYHLFPWWPGVFHSHWMYRRSHFHRIWHSDPLWKPEWVLVSGSFQDPPKSLTSLHSWNVWDMVLLRKQEKQKAKGSFWIRTDKCDLNLEHRWNRMQVPCHSCRKP